MSYAPILAELAVLEENRETLNLSSRSRYKRGHLAPPVTGQHERYAYPSD
jgi:hypothetical protein